MFKVTHYRCPRITCQALLIRQETQHMSYGNQILSSHTDNVAVFIVAHPETC